jgi:methylmalonyl-CoA/ethylmalonyl-CoA epimerase
MHTQRFGPVKQWGFVVRDLDAAMQCWVEQLGVGPWWGYRNVRLNSRFQGIESEVLLDVALSYQNGVQIELIQQRDDSPSPYRAFYATPHAQMLHQVAYMVPDLDVALLEAKAAGLTELGMLSNGDSRYYYLDSPALTGLVVELMQADPAFLADYERCAAEAARWDGSNPYRLIG